MTIIDGSYNAGISSFQSPLVLMKGRVFMEGVICLGGIGVVELLFTLRVFGHDMTCRQILANRLALFLYYF